MDIATRTTVPLTELEDKPLKKRRLWPAILMLYVLAALIPECVATYNTAPRSFLVNPALFFYETAFYGSAGLLIREAMRRRRRGWTCFILLGIAFGFINEGIIAGTWYTTVPNGYTLVAGIDWAWAVALTAFHTIYSVVIPIVLVESFFSDLAGQSWLKRRGLCIAGLLLLLTTLLGLLTPTYRAERWLVLLAVIGLTALALRLPVSQTPLAMSWRTAPGLFKLRLAGFGGTLLFFAAIILFPALISRAVLATQRNSVQILHILFTLLVCVLLLVLARRWSSYRGWNASHRLALITGALLPTILLSLFLPQEWLVGQPVVTLPCLILLIWTALRVRRKLTSNSLNWASEPFREF